MSTCGAGPRRTPGCEPTRATGCCSPTLASRPTLRRQPYRQRLELVDERRLDHRRCAVDLHRRVALQRFLEQDLELESRQGRPEAEVPPTGAECLVVGVAPHVEAVGVLVT